MARSTWRTCPNCRNRISNRAAQCAYCKHELSGAPAGAAAVRQSPSPQEPSIATQIEALLRLRESGEITAEQYEEAKRRVTAASGERSSTPSTPRNVAPATTRHRSGSGRRGVLGLIGTVLAVGMICWAIYANQDAQRFKCAAYRISGVSRPLLWNVTCLLNGNL